MTKEEDKEMLFKEALEKLKIPEFEERIYYSNSHGELIHLYDYYGFAQHTKDPDAFRELFLIIVGYAEKTWKRPESVFQHMPKMFKMFRQASEGIDDETES